MKRFGRAMAGVIGWVLAVCGGMLFLGSAVDFHRTDSPRGPSGGFAVGFFLVVAVAGAALIRLAWPGLLARIGREILATCTSLTRFSSPLVHGLAIYLLALPFLAVTGGASILVALAFMFVYTVASPLLIALRPRLWLNAPLSIVVGIVLLGALPATAEALAHRRFSDDWMVMLGPVMLYPVVFIAAIAFRVVWKTRGARVAAAAPGPGAATPDVAQQETLR
jgi:hypothetical protein